MAKIMQPRTYDYEGWLELKGNRSERKIGHNTTVRTVIDRAAGLGVAIRYHYTDVVTFWQDGSIVLNSGGFRTSTTKQRMNACLPMSVRVFQRDYVWFVQRGPWDGGDTIEYEDNMTVAGGGN